MIACLDDVEAKAISIASVDEEFLKESKGIVIGSPSYAASLTPDLHAWLLSASGKYGFAGKLGGGEFDMESILNGCQEGKATARPVERKIERVLHFYI